MNNPASAAPLQAPYFVIPNALQPVRDRFSDCFASLFRRIATLS
jgi:hypothetical protein